MIMIPFLSVGFLYTTPAPSVFSTRCKAELHSTKSTVTKVTVLECDSVKQLFPSRRCYPFTKLYVVTSETREMLILMVTNMPGLRPLSSVYLPYTDL
jgi:hypothetical protein